jgi:hypothetical protein
VGNVLDSSVPTVLTLDSFTLYVQLALVLRSDLFSQRGSHSLVNLLLLHAAIKSLLSISDEFVAFRYENHSMGSFGIMFAQRFRGQCVYSG